MKIKQNCISWVWSHHVIPLVPKLFSLPLVVLYTKWLSVKCEDFRHWYIGFGTKQPPYRPLLQLTETFDLSSGVQWRIASNWLWLRCYQLFGSNMAAHLTLERLNSCLQAVVISQTSSGIRLLLIFPETNMREQMCNDLSDFLDKAVLYENNSQFLLRLTWWQSRWRRIIWPFIPIHLTLLICVVLSLFWYIHKLLNWLINMIK